jgi:hypothetical protein
MIIERMGWFWSGSFVTLKLVLLLGSLEPERLTTYKIVLLFGSG